LITLLLLLSLLCIWSFWLVVPNKYYTYTIFAFKDTSYIHNERKLFIIYQPGEQVTKVLSFISRFCRCTIIWIEDKLEDNAIKIITNYATHWRHKNLYIVKTDQLLKGICNYLSALLREYSVWIFETLVFFLYSKIVKPKNVNKSNYIITLEWCYIYSITFKLIHFLHLKSIGAHKMNSPLWTNFFHR
jgi:hypothetical protein